MELKVRKGSRKGETGIINYNFSVSLIFVLSEEKCFLFCAVSSVIPCAID